MDLSDLSIADRLELAAQNHPTITILRTACHYLRSLEKEVLTLTEELDDALTDKIVVMSGDDEICCIEGELASNVIAHAVQSYVTKTLTAYFEQE